MFAPLSFGSYHAVVRTLGRAYKDFGYNEYPAITNKFNNVKKFRLLRTLLTTSILGEEAMLVLIGWYMKAPWFWLADFIWYPTVWLYCLFLYSGDKVKPHDENISHES